MSARQAQNDQANAAASGRIGRPGSRGFARGLLHGLLLVTTGGVAAASPRALTHHPSAPEAPHSLGRFGDWQAAVHQEGGVAVCYAFSRARPASHALAGRGDVVLTVTARPGGREVVAISAGYPIAGRQDATVMAGETRLRFYVAGRSAFARDGGAAIAAFERASLVTSVLAGPHNTEVADRFSLAGFTAAHRAIVTGCPAR